MEGTMGPFEPPRQALTKSERLERLEDFLIQNWGGTWVNHVREFDERLGR